MVEIERAMDVARHAARAGADAALSFFERRPSSERKVDGTLVTEADHAADHAIIEIIRTAFPDHEILTEESGSSGPAGAPRWIVDPLDGTHRFARGLPFWGPLIALQVEGRVVVGAAALPVLGARYWAGEGLGCWRDDTRLRVSDRCDWSASNLCLGSLARLLDSQYGERALELVRGAEYTMSGSDMWGGVLVLEGKAEAWLESGVQIWDIAPFPILLEEAGGRWSDFEGRASIESGQIVAGNETAHARAVRTLRASRG